MSRIHSIDTKPELTVRKALHAAGYRFRLHRKDLPGSPDIVLPKYRLVIFIHGCFWHRHQTCRKWSVPNSNKDYWEKKFSSNVERDLKAITALEELGWRTVVIWECEVKKMNDKDIAEHILKTN